MPALSAAPRAMAPNDPDAIEPRIAAVRRFSRFYTRRLGLLEDGFLESPFSLAEARVLYELAQRQSTTATALAGDLGIDPGYLSRMLRGFAERGLIRKTRSPDDRRHVHLSLTSKGRKAYAPLEQRSHDEVAAMLKPLSANAQRRVVTAMGAIENLIGGAQGENRERRAYVLRSPRTGEMGWVVARHAALYAQEHGWGLRFEGLCAEIVAEMIAKYDAARDRFFIADIDGEPVGSAFIVKESDVVARLRLLLVEPKARGLGIGKRLVEECIAFARATGYTKITLWTHSVLTAARKIYQGAGFEKIAEQPHAAWGVEVVGETWEMPLRA